MESWIYHAINQSMGYIYTSLICQSQSVSKVMEVARDYFVKCSQPSSGDR